MTAFPALKDAQEKLDAKRKELADVFAEAGPDYDMSKVKSLEGTNADKVSWIQQKNSEIDDLKKEVVDLQEVEKAAGHARDHQSGESGDGSGTKDTKGRFTSLGKSFVESDAFTGYKQGSGMGPVARLDVPDLKTLFQTSAGWDPEDIRTGRVEFFPTRPAPHVVDAVPETQTSMSTVLYMEETTYGTSSGTDAAETSEGSTYTETQLALTEQSSEVRKIAVFLPVTDEQFEDEPRSRTYVENRLPFMVRQRLDSQVLVGNGTPPNLTGTENVTGIQSQSLGTDPIPDAVFKAMRQVRDDGFAEPSVMFIAPSKWETVRLLRTSDGMYIWGPPSQAGPETMWGVPVVQTTAVTSTKVVLGDYANFSELAVRRGMDVQVSNSHSDFFVNGKLAIRADIRVALIHYRPKAFAEVTGL